MSALEWLDEVRADLDVATPGPWRWRNTEEPLLVGARSRIVMAFSRMGTPGAQPEFRDADGLLTKAGKANLYSYPDARLIASAPDRLDRMERALRAALEAHDWTMHCGNVRHTRADAACDQCEAVCVACGERYPCPTVTTIREALGDE